MKIKKFDSINVIPFIDIMLVLLVIVLISASFVNKKYISVDLPNAKSSSAASKKSKEIVVTIKKNGDIFLDKRKTNKEQLKSIVLTLKKDREVVINCDKKSSFENFLLVLDSFKSAKFKNISIVTKDE
jgi:biopolymer transport protein ExbD